jgi:hypothetical protein
MNESHFRKILESVFAALAIAVFLILSPLLRRWYNHWGAASEEVKRALPGDERVQQPRLTYTRAITIHARPAQIWHWLVQLGQERSGFYSYEPLENLIGCQIHDPERIIPEWQHLEIGDAIRLGPKGYPLYKVVALERERFLVVAGADPATEQVPPITDPMPPVFNNFSWCFTLIPRDDGTTRLLVRARQDYRPSSFANLLLWRVFMEPINFIMERKTLLGLKSRAEATQTPPEPQPIKLAVD